MRANKKSDFEILSLLKEAARAAYVYLYGIEGKQGRLVLISPCTLLAGDLLRLSINFFHVFHGQIPGEVDLGSH